MRAFRFLTNFEISSEEISKKQKNFEMEKEGNFDISFFFLVYTVASNRKNIKVNFVWKVKLVKIGIKTKFRQSREMDL